MSTSQRLANRLFFVALLMKGLIIHGQTVYTWTGSADSNWANAANWSGGLIAATNGSYNARITVTNPPSNPLNYTASEGNTVYAANGGSTSGRSLVIASGSGITGTMNISGGVWESRGNAPDIIGNSGIGGNTVGTLTVTGGSYINTNSTAYQEILMSLTGDNVSTLNVNSGTAAVSMITFGSSSVQTSTNIINLNGGILSVKGIDFTPAYIGASNLATINFNGGTLQAFGYANSFSNLTGVSNTVNVTAVNVFANGATIDSQGFVFSTTNAFLHGGTGLDGGLVKNGSGTLMMSGQNTYNGPTTVNGGRIVIGGALGAGNYANAITNNGTLLYSGSAAQLLGGIVSGTGAVTMAGSGTLSLNAANTYSGATTISNGVLNITTASIGGGTYTNLSGTTLGVAVAGSGQSLAMSGWSIGTACTGSLNLGNFGNPTAPVIYATNLVVTGTNMINVFGSYLDVGQFTLIKYGTASGLTSGSFTTNFLPLGMVASISNNVANSSIDLVVTRSIPSAALRDPRYALGYLVATYYPGVTNNGTGDCRAGIQAALDDAYAANQIYQRALYTELAATNYVMPFTNRPVAVFFPPGTYQISDVLQCYEWVNISEVPDYGFDSLIGSTEGLARPKIILAAGAPNYQSTSAPRQMISFRCFKGTNGVPVPVPNPMSAPTNFTDWNGGNMDGPELRNIDFDCNNNPGAVGVVFTGAQGCSMENVKVSATNAFAGFYELPGAGAVSANLEVDGGQYGVVHGRYTSLGLTIAQNDSGPTVVGLTLANQTTAALKCFDEDAPITVVGFNITNCQGVAVQNENYYSTSGGTLTLLDGQIEMGSTTNPLAIDNTAGKDFYIRNVYISGTTNLVESYTTATSGSGTWSQIAEYSYNDFQSLINVPPNTNYPVNIPILESYSDINGLLQNYAVPFPIAPNVIANSSAPPTNLVSEHLWSIFPSYNGSTNDPATVVVSTDAGWNNAGDSTALLQAAIDAAHTNNGRVFIPGGLYYITNTLTLYTNTVLLGAGREITWIEASQTWMPTNGQVTMMKTMDSPSATTTLAYLSLSPRRTINAAGTNYQYFNTLTWQAGSNSIVLGMDVSQPWLPYTNSQPRSLVLYTNDGGGQWYSLCLSASTGEANPGFRKIKISGTSQPLWFYGFNMEHGAGNMEAEIDNASNIRFLGLKREGYNPLLVLSNCTNIAGYGLGRAINPPSGNGIFQVLGTSTNVLLANLTVYAPSTSPLMTGNILYESLTGLPSTNILWPNMVSLYKRGEINDSVMTTFAASQAVIHRFLTIVDAPILRMNQSGSQLSISWTGGGVLQSADNVTGPYSTVPSATSPYTMDVSNIGAKFFRVAQ